MDPINALRSSGADAYELVDQLPRGPARAAAWNAYVFQTYGDKLIAATGRKGLPSATYAVVAESFSLSNSWLQRASALAADPAATADVEADAELPCFHTPIRSQEQLIGMREAAEALRIYVAFDLQGLSADAALIDEFRQQLAEIDEQMERAAMLWVEHSPPELLGGVGDAMLKALAQVQTLGQLLARTQP